MDKNYKVKSLCNGWGTIIKISKNNKMFFVKFENGKKNVFDKNGNVFRLIHKVPPEKERIVNLRKQ